MPGERRYFGTDGVRGIVGADLTEGLVAGLGRAFATWSGGAPVLIGRDTRGSGASLELALSAGLAAGGSEPSWGGILPTPAVALLAEGAGAVISASHNPPEWNGVKFFAPGGRKLTDEEEAAIEALLEEAAPLEPTAERWPEPDDALARALRRARRRALRRAARRPADRLRLRERGHERPRPARLRAARRARSRPSRTSPTARTSTSAAARPTSACSPGRSPRATSTSASPSTATAIACSRSTPRGDRSTATRSWRSSRSTSRSSSSRSPP